METLTDATAPPMPWTRIVQLPFAPLLPCPVADTLTVVRDWPTGADDGAIASEPTSPWHSPALIEIVPLGPDCCTVNDPVGCCDVSVRYIGAT